MLPIDKAIEDLKLHKPGEQRSLKEISEKYGVDRSTLGRRAKGLTSSKTDGYAKQQNLSPQQELELVSYIEDRPRRALNSLLTYYHSASCEAT
jgi:hypothetical protein